MQDAREVKFPGSVTIPQKSVIFRWQRGSGFLDNGHRTRVSTRRAIRRPPFKVAPPQRLRRNAAQGKGHAMPLVNPEQFADRVYEASKAAFSALIGENTSQTFYSFGLWTDDSLQFLHPAANTEQALTATVQRYRETVDPKYGCNSTRAGMRWSYGDWGFFPYEDGDHFGEINRILSSNFDSMVADEEFDGGLELLWASTLKGFHWLESEGFFGTGPARSKVTLLVVGHLPSELVNAWLSALNPPDVVEKFTRWNCDAPDSGE